MSEKINIINFKRQKVAVKWNSHRNMYQGVNNGELPSHTNCFTNISRKTCTPFPVDPYTWRSFLRFAPLHLALSFLRSLLRNRHYLLLFIFIFFSVNVFSKKYLLVRWLIFLGVPAMLRTLRVLNLDYPSLIRIGILHEYLSSTGSRTPSVFVPLKQFLAYLQGFGPRRLEFTKPLH